jgi:methylthioribose-1-phosphate isomerase
MSPFDIIRWEDRGLRVLDQTLLPGTVEYRRLEGIEAVWEAIKALRVRGAPLIGVTAAYGILVGLVENPPCDVAEAVENVRKTAEYLATSRPTAVNLFWALGRMSAAAESAKDSPTPGLFLTRLETEADALFRREAEACRAIGSHGAVLIHEGDGVLTHCNAGALATGEYGTALAPMYRAHEEGRGFRVYADETRPLLQGARLTSWELQGAGIDVTLICDNMAAQVMREGKIQLVITGADRIAANGDTANKIGTYGVALLAKAHGIPFYIAAPLSTFDTGIPDGGHIPIEIRAADEITHGFGLPTAPEGIKVYNPAFDVTPNGLIAGFITERGLITPPYGDNILGGIER